MATGPTRQHPLMTLEEHLDYSKQLKTFTERYLSAGIINKFPKASKQSRALRNARDAMNSLRWALEDDLCRVVPEDDPVWNWSKFYTGDADEDPRRPSKNSRTQSSCPNSIKPEGESA